MSGRIWLIGGTSESVFLAKALVDAGLSCTVTVTTNVAKLMYGNLSQLLRISIGKLTAIEMQEFCLSEKIVAIVDASHPYAAMVSQGAISTAQMLNIAYLRYERPSIIKSNCVVELDSFDRLLESNYLAGERVFLAIGYQVLPRFIDWQEKAVLFARILPTLFSLETALKAGFTNDRLIALRPPISYELEKALWQQWQISLVVTKANGKAGGEDLKLNLARELGIKSIVISRPSIVYPRQTERVDEVLIFCRSQWYLSNLNN